MKAHQIRPGFRSPEPTTTDPNEYEVGQEVTVTLRGTIARVQAAGNGRAALKIDTAPGTENGQFVFVITDLGDDVTVEVL